MTRTVFCEGGLKKTLFSKNKVISSRLGNSVLISKYRQHNRSGFKNVLKNKQNFQPRSEFSKFANQNKSKRGDNNSRRKGLFLLFFIKLEQLEFNIYFFYVLYVVYLPILIYFKFRASNQQSSFSSS